MKKNSLKRMLELADAEQNAAEAPKANEKAAKSAAERLGEALLSSLGGVEGVSEDELVDALLGEWKPRAAAAEAEPEAHDETPAAEMPGGEAQVNPFGENARMPVPMKADAANTEPMDYSEMSAEQFAKLRKLLKRAAADGKRIRL